MGGEERGFPANPPAGTLVKLRGSGRMAVAVGPTDARTRILAQYMKPSLGQSLLVENVTGASGSIGAARAARAAPDGYTLSSGDWSTHVVNGAIYALHYDVLSDFAPIALL